MTTFISESKLTRRLFPFMIFFMLSVSGITESHAQRYAGTYIKAFSEAVGIIEQKALLPKSRREIITGALRAYLKTQDNFSGYLDSEEYSAFRHSQSGRYVGLGMDIEKTTSGEFVCFPYPSNPAYKAGIRSGDILLAIDGMRVSGKTVFQIAAKAMGDKNTKASVKIKRKTGVIQEFSIVRGSVVSKSVELKLKDGFSILRVFRFTPSTPREIRLAMENIGEETIIIDLRENPGGDLHAAIDSAMLFLEKSKKVVDVESRKDSRSYAVTSSPQNATSPLYIWQNEYTASAAEVFTAALVQNSRAESIGKKTFGKGTQQQIVELSDGSALFLTTAHLKTPNGLIYHEIGLQPTHPLKTDAPDFSVYLAKTKKMISGANIAAALSDKPQSVKEPVLTPSEPKKQSPALAASPQPPKNMSDNGQTKIVSFEKDKIEPSFICFIDTFDTEKDAEVWTETVRNSIQTDKSFYQFQRRTSKGVKFVVCMGGYRDKEVAERRRLRIAEAMNAEMFIKDLNEDANGGAPNPTDPPPVESDSDESWYVQAGSYRQYESIMAAIEQLQTKGMGKKYPLWIRIIYGASDPPLSAKKNFERYGIRVQLLKSSEVTMDTAYRLYIGPYGDRNEAFLNLLKEDGLVKKDAFWNQLGK